MASYRFIDIDGKRYLWRELLQLRREQKKARLGWSNQFSSNLRMTAVPKLSARRLDASGNHPSFRRDQSWSSARSLVSGEPLLRDPEMAG
jgi:hypothetical protein